MIKGALNPCQIDRCVPAKLGCIKLARVTLLTKSPASKAGKMPIKIHKIAKIIAGKCIPKGGSCAALLGT